MDSTASIFVKERDDETGEMKSKPVENTEDIEFYYDVLHEYVAFISRRINGGAEIIQDDLKQLVTMNEDIPILDLTQRG